MCLFQTAATAAFLTCCVVLAMKTGRFKKRVQAASAFFLARWEKVHASDWANAAGGASADAINASEYDGRAIDPDELERIARDARIREIEINDLARRLGHSLIAENTALHAHTRGLSSGFAYYFLGAEFLMVLAIISWAVAVAGGATAEGYAGAVPADLHVGVGVGYICATGLFVAAVIGAPLSITHRGLKVCGAFRRRPCAVWNAVGDHLHRDVLAFETLGHVIGPSAFLVGAYAVSSFFVWKWVETTSGFDGIDFVGR